MDLVAFASRRLSVILALANPMLDAPQAPGAPVALSSAADPIAADPCLREAAIPCKRAALLDWPYWVAAKEESRPAPIAFELVRTKPSVAPAAVEANPAN